MAASSKSLYYLITFLLVISTVKSSKLNVPRVLLPYYINNPVNFTLEVSEGGCYKWQSTRPGVVQVEMIDLNPVRGCSTRAVVSAVSKQPTHQTSLVLAEDDATGQRLNCDVIVDAIHSLEIVRTTAELYLDDAPELVAARAKDKNGDTFSTLDGITFHWSLITDEDTYDVIDANSILRIVPFSLSKYDAPQSIKTLEDKGEHGYMVLLEGKSTGSAKVTVQLIDPTYRNISSDEITLVVVANVMLNPAYDVYLLEGSLMHYKVELIRQGKPYEIEMPSDQFYLEVKDPTVASLDRLSNNLTALAFGTTEIILKDRHMKMKESQRQPLAGIHVVAADHLGMMFLPYENWLLEIGRPYKIIINMFDNRNNKIYPSDNIEIVLNLPENSFQLLFSTKNGTYHEIVPLKIGTVIVEAVLKPLMQGGREISLKQTIEICEPVQIVPNLIILPWDPVMKPTNNIILKATGGGDTNYQWSSDNSEVALINQKGELTIYSMGIVNISASSVRNNHLLGKAKIVILPVVDLEILPAPFEAETDKSVYLPVVMYGDSSSFASHSEKNDKNFKIAFTDCRKLSLKVEVMDPKKFEYNSEGNALPSSVGCVTLVFNARSVGSSKVIVSYYNGDSELKTSVVIASYNPLKALTSDKIVMALGSSKQVAFEGGPRAWVLKPDLHFKKISIMNESIATVQPLEEHECTSKDVHVFNVVCTEKGETKIHLVIGNDPSATLPEPTQSKFNVTISCSIPSSIFLQPKVKRPTSAGSSCITDVNRLPVQNYRNIAIGIVMTDDEGNKFDNFTSLFLEWEISDINLASLPNVANLQTHWHEPTCYKVITYIYQNIILHGREGSVKIKASLVGYKPNEAGNMIFLAEEITNSIDLDLVGDAVISPKKVSVFNHPSNEMQLSILRGSGQFEVNPKANYIAKIKYDELTHKVHIYPLKDGSFTLTAQDLCLETQEMASALVRVTGIKTIEVKMMDKVELNKEIFATVYLLDPDDQCLPVSVSTLTNLHAVSGANIISIKANPTSSKDPCEAVFLIQGRSLGHTTLAFQANVKPGASSESTISSELIPIQVFPPLRLHPCNVTLIIGSVFQVISSGGPQPQVTIEYKITNSSISYVSGAGIIRALNLGTSEVIANAVGINPESGKTIVYSQDEIKLSVVQLSNIRIYAPITNIKAGNEMLVYAIGGNEYETPFSFVSADPPLEYVWDTSDNEIVSIEPVFLKAGIQSNSENMFVVRIVAKRPGQVSIRLKMSALNNSHQIYQNWKLSDSLQIQVFEGLKLISLPLSYESVLITPSTALKLTSNKDGVRPISYDIVTEHGQEYISHCLKIDQKGVLHTGPRSCRAGVIMIYPEEVGVNQSLIVPFEVKHVSYIMVSFPKLKHIQSQSIHVVPVGGVLQFQLTFHDNAGNMFHTTNVPLQYRPSRYDILEIVPDNQNYTYTIKSLRIGQTVIKFWHSRNPRIETYINVIAGNGISPTSTSFIVGDIVCFSTPVISDEGKHGIWHSDNKKIVQIDSQSGLAIIMNAGTATVYYEISPEVILHTDILSSPISSISILPHTHRLFTNSWSQKTYDIAISLNGEKIHNKINLKDERCTKHLSSSWINSQFPFQCSLKFISSDIDIPVTDVFQVKEVFSTALDQYACRLETIVSSQYRMKLSSIVSNLELSVKVPAQNTQPSVPAQSIELPFVPIFHVLVEELSLSTVQPLGCIPVSAVSDAFKHLMIVPSDSNVLEVLAEEQDPQLQNVRRFPIRLRDGCWEPREATYTIDIMWEFSDDVSSIPVSVKFMVPASGDCTYSHQSAGWARMIYAASSNYQSYLITVLSLAGTAVAILIGYWVMFSQGFASPAVNAEGYSNSPTPRTFLYRSPTGMPTVQPQDYSTPGRPLLWSDNLPMQRSPKSSPQSPLTKLSALSPN